MDLIGEAVQLQFTQGDRDMLRDTNADVKRILQGMEKHDAEDARQFKGIDDRLTALEKWQTRVIAICSAVGFLIGLAAKALWH